VRFQGGIFFTPDTVLRDITRCWRVRSILTQEVHMIEATNVNIHAAFVRITSSQLPFLG